MLTNFSPHQQTSNEGYAPVRGSQLFYREIGHGKSMFILHGGPDFNHDYLLPEMDRLSDLFRLIYYDQRGRGKSGENVHPEDVSMDTEISDLDMLRDYFKLETVAILGHSWGGLLAMEYAIRHPHRVSHLILMNSAPASHDDLLYFRQERLKKEAETLEKLKVLTGTAGYVTGDLEADANYHRIHFRAALRQPQHIERLVNKLRLSFTPEGIRKARAIENRLYEETWVLPQFNLLPKLRQLSIPTLVIHGEYDFIPVVCALHIAEAFREAQFVLLKECGHFSYLECPEETHNLIADFFTNR